VRVGVDAYLLHGGGGYRSAGVSTYTGNLLRALPPASPNNEYVAFLNRGVVGPPDVSPASAPFDVSRPAIRALWEQVGLPAAAARSGVDVLHGAVNVIPLLYGRPTVVTVHDLSFFRFPERLTRARRVYLGAAVSLSARRATRVIAVSENTKRDLVELLGVEDERIHVVYPGVSDQFRPLPASAIPFGRPYILHVGTLEPRKNIDLLIRAYAGLRRRDVDHALVLIGARGWMYQNLFDLVQRLDLRDHVRFLDYVPPTELPRWYNGADLFVYPSAYEGFGLPVLEAMACGTPVITSSSSSLGELAGGACLTIETGSHEELEETMVRGLQDSSLRDTLREAGLRRAERFTWMRTAAETAAVYGVAYRA
jgi:glycosyltransferase involved in cell wall biosynthesis